jgi:Uma2 family endonuclease
MFMEILLWTSHDLEFLPDNGKRYEIIDGELYVSDPFQWEHQLISAELGMLLSIWSEQTGRGIANGAPGLIFDDYNDVVPDVVWISQERLATALQSDGKLHSAPELAIEILSPGPANERRDREVKLKLYSRRGVLEYWVVNWQERSVEIYQRERALLTLDRKLYAADVLESPLLPGFSCLLSQLFDEVSREL